MHALGNTMCQHKMWEHEGRTSLESSWAHRPLAVLCRHHSKRVLGSEHPAGYGVEVCTQALASQQQLHQMGGANVDPEQSEGPGSTSVMQGH